MFLVMHKRYQRQGHFRCDRRGAGEDDSEQGPRDRSGGTKGLNRSKMRDESWYLR